MNSRELEHLLAGLFPEEVVTEAGLLRETRGDLYGEEQACVRHVVDQRKREFVAGRICARRALGRLGILRFPLVAGRDRAPVWPPGIIGSISHCADYCGVAVARQNDLTGIGLDLERTNRVHEELWPYICTAEELAWVNSLPYEQRRPAAAVIFSVKESLYKCQYLVTGRWLEFTEVVVHVGCRRLEYDVASTVSSSVSIAGELRGRFILHDDLVLTAATLRRPGEVARL